MPYFSGHMRHEFYTNFLRTGNHNFARSLASHGSETEEAVVLVYYVLPTGNWLPGFQRNNSFRNVGKELCKDTASYPSITDSSAIPMFKGSCVVVSLGPCYI